MGPRRATRTRLDPTNMTPKTAPSRTEDDLSLCRSLCLFCRNEYASSFNVLRQRWEHPYGRKLIRCEADAVRDDPE